MAKVYFCNAEPIDLNAIAVLGVSVKVTDNPVGFFGTGSRFAIATLLRTGHKVTLIRDGVVIEFVVRPEVIRGQTFERVFMGSDPLGFTTMLGRNWEPWQAYRELRCNCIDENGVISDEMPPGDWGTIFIVEGEAISQCHRNRREIFLESHPLSGTEDCAIHNGQSAYAFYRGVRAHSHQSVSLFTYNILAKTDLTEDRTVRYGYMVGYYAVRAVAQCEDESAVEAALMAPRGTFESSFDYSGIDEKPSLAFMDVAFRLRHNVHCNRSAIKLWERNADIRLTYIEVDLDEFDEQQIEAALRLVARLGADVSRRDFIVVDGLGADIYGCVRASRILIARAALDHGIRFLAGTIYEEWLHKKESVQDETRALQNLLLDKLFSMTERVCALEAMRPVRVAA